MLTLFLFGLWGAAPSVSMFNPIWALNANKTLGLTIEPQ